MENIVYIATSIDGYIADRNGGLGWLQAVPNPDNIDFGFNDFLDSIDAVVMGRNTYETVLSMGADWPYSKPVFVCSRSLKSVPTGFAGEVAVISGSPEEICASMKERGYGRLYIDGGRTIQSFLAAGLIDEMIITKIPVLLGGGTPLFADLPEHQEFELISSEILPGHMVSLRYRKKL